MRGNYAFVSEASLIEALPRFSPTRLASFLLPQDRQGDPAVNLVADSSLLPKKQRRGALVVDDVADVTEMLSVFLTLAGYDVVTAHSAYAAIELARSANFDVVVSDIGMPVMNGYELARALRTLPGFEAVPMIAVTGFSMYDDQQRSLQAGFNAHLTKPIDPNVLFRLIEQLRG